MNKNDIATLSLRLISVVLFVYFIDSFVTTLRFSTIGALGNTSGYVYLSALPLVCSVLVWLFAPEISTFINSKDTSTVETDWSFESAQSLGFTLVGLLVLSFTIPLALNWGIALIMNTQMDLNYSAKVSFYSETASVIVRLLIGTYLFLGAKGLSDFLRKIRASGRNEGLLTNHPSSDE